MIASRTAPSLLTAVVLAALLTACGGGTPSATPDADDTETSTPIGSPTPDPDDTDEPDPDDSDDPEPEPGFTDDDRANLREAITSGNTAAIEGYLSNPVRVIIMSSECCFDITPAEAVSNLSYVTGAPGPWNFSLPSSTTDSWHTNAYYGYLFTGDDVTGMASDGTVVSFGISGEQVVTILMGFEEGFTY